MKLLLTSAGLSTNEIKQRFLELVGKNANQINVAFIPTAADLEEDKWFVEKDNKILLDLGVKIKIVDLKQSKNELANDLKGVDVIYVEGGNTFYLLYWVFKSGFDLLLREFLDNGGLYIGVSAGSIITCPSIESAGWKGFDDPSIVKLKNNDGLHLVDFGIFPHYETKYDELIKNKSKNLSYKIETLTNEQAFAVDGSKLEKVG